MRIKYLTYSLVLFGFLVLIFSSHTDAQTDEAESSIEDAILELSEQSGIVVNNRSEAAKLCNQPKYHDLCSSIGQKHRLYSRPASATEQKRIEAIRPVPATTTINISNTPADLDLKNIPAICMQYIRHFLNNERPIPTILQTKPIPSRNPVLDDLLLNFPKEDNDDLDTKFNDIDKNIESLETTPISITSPFNSLFGTITNYLGSDLW